MLLLFNRDGYEGELTITKLKITPQFSQLRQQFNRSLPSLYINPKKSPGMSLITISCNHLVPCILPHCLVIRPWNITSMPTFKCLFLALFIFLSFFGGEAARNLLQLPNLPSVPNLPKPTLPPLPSIPTLPQPTLPITQPSLPKPTLPPLPSLPTMPTMPAVPKLTLPPLPSMPTLPTVPKVTLPPLSSMPSMPTIPIPTALPSIPFLSPPPATTKP